MPPVCAQHLGEKLFKRKPRRAEGKDRPLDRITSGDGRFFFPPEHVKCASVDLLGHHARMQFLQYMREPPRPQRARCSRQLERMFEFRGIEWFPLTVRLGNKNV